MALIIHRCTCGHPDFFHPASTNSCSMCLCSSLDKQDTPEVIPTFDALGKLKPAVVAPGGKYNNFHIACNCNACQQLYADTGGVAA